MNQAVEPLAPSGCLSAKKESGLRSKKGSPMWPSSLRHHLTRAPRHTAMPNRRNKALDAEPPISSFLKSRLIGGGAVNASVISAEPFREDSVMVGIMAHELPIQVPVVPPLHHDRMVQFLVTF